MHYLYILYSKSLDKYYIGETNDVQNRLVKHNINYYKKGYTKAAKDWEVVLEKQCLNKDETLFLEKFIKRMKSKVFIRKIIDNPMILDDILSKR
jgi:putative endonuclease